jgi:hypothetical protein
MDIDCGLTDEEYSRRRCRLVSDVVVAREEKLESVRQGEAGHRDSSLSEGIGVSSGPAEPYFCWSLRH